MASALDFEATYPINQALFKIFLHFCSYFPFVGGLAPLFYSVIL